MPEAIKPIPVREPELIALEARRKFAAVQDL
jgi:hypothetical protein